MKSLAATILGQRSETEQFFLESLQEVREVLRKERKLQQTQLDNKLLLNKLKQGGGSALTTFPPLNIKGSNLHHLSGKYNTQLTTNKVAIDGLESVDGEKVTDHKRPVGKLFFTVMYLYTYTEMVVDLDKGFELGGQGVSSQSALFKDKQRGIE